MLRADEPLGDLSLLRRCVRSLRVNFGRKVWDIGLCGVGGDGMRK